jgi:RHS repeat-associated protein
VAGKEKSIVNRKSKIGNRKDRLGTERARSNSSGARCETIASLPFGDGQTIAGSCGDPSPNHFTGKERDAETNLDNFGARYNASNLGRFMSPDPSNLSVDFWLPQT